MNNLVIEIVNDSGHAWGKVHVKLIASCLVDDQISSYSYIKGKTVYLEEDSDLPKFINAFKKHNPGMGIDFVETFYDGDCFVRALPRYEYIPQRL